MKTQFAENKRMQLLIGSKVICIKSVEGCKFPDGKGSEYYYDSTLSKQVYSDIPLYDFTEGKEYPVIHANVLIGDLSGGHTWDIGVFREHFKELSNSHI